MRLLKAYGLQSLRGKGVFSKLSLRSMRRLSETSSCNPFEVRECFQSTELLDADNDDPIIRGILLQSLLVKGVFSKCDTLHSCTSLFGGPPLLQSLRGKGVFSKLEEKPRG